MSPDTPPEHADQERLKDLIRENQELIAENNKLLKSINKKLWWGFWARIVWYALLIGIPFALYYYVLDPYFSALGSSFETFSEGMQEIPGWKQLYNAIEGGSPTGE